MTGTLRHNHYIIGIKTIFMALLASMFLWRCSAGKGLYRSSSDSVSILTRAMAKGPKENNYFYNIGAVSALCDCKFDFKDNDTVVFYCKGNDLLFDYQEIYGKSSVSEIYMTMNNVPAIGEPVPIMRDRTYSRRSPKYYSAKKPLLDAVYHNQDEIINQYVRTAPRKWKGEFHIVWRIIIKDGSPAGKQKWWLVEFPSELQWR